MASLSSNKVGYSKLTTNANSSSSSSSSTKKKKKKDEETNLVEITDNKTKTNKLVSTSNSNSSKTLGVSNKTVTSSILDRGSNGISLYNNKSNLTSSNAVSNKLSTTSQIINNEKTNTSLKVDRTNLNPFNSENVSSISGKFIGGSFSNNEEKEKNVTIRDYTDDRTLEERISDGLEQLLTPMNFLNIAGKAVLGIGEDVLDTATNVGDWVNDSIAYKLGVISKDEYEKRRKATQEYVSEDQVENLWKALGWDDETTNYVNSNTVVNEENILGKVETSVVQNLARMAMGEYWIPATFAEKAGGAMEEAYASGETNDQEVLLSAIWQGTNEVLAEKLFGGLKLPGTGGGTLESFESALVDKIKDNSLKGLAGFGINAVNEGMEEVITGYADALAKKYTYMSEKEINEIYSSEDALEDFVMAGISTSILNGASKSTYQSISEGRNLISNETQEENDTVKKVTEARISEQEQNGTKLTDKEKNNIQKQVKQELEDGTISVNEIEKILDNEDYSLREKANNKLESLQIEKENLDNKKMSDMTTSEYEQNRNRSKELETEIEKQKDIVKSANINLAENMQKQTKNNNYIQKSYYNEIQKNTPVNIKTKNFKTKSALKTIENAQKAGVTNEEKNNTFISNLAKISEKTGTEFDFTNFEELQNQNRLSEKNLSEEDTAKLLQLTEEYENATTFKERDSISKSMRSLMYRDTGGYVIKSGNNTKIVLNLDSDSGMNSVVGHEIKHLLEQSGLNKELNEMLRNHAKEKGILNKYIDEVEKNYEGIDGVKISDEVYANMTSDLLFNDESFIESLAEKPTLFSKISQIIDDFIDALGISNKESAELRRIQKKFREVYNDRNKQVAKETKKTGTKSLSKDNTRAKINYSIQTDANGNKYVNVDTDQDIFEGKSLSEQTKIAKKYILDNFRENGINVANENINVTARTANEYTHPKNKNSKDVSSSKMKASTELENLLNIAEYSHSSSDDGRHTIASDGWDYYTVKFKVGNQMFEGLINIAKNGNIKTLYDITRIKKTSRVGSDNKSLTTNAMSSYANNVSQSTQNVNKDTSSTQYSIQNNENNTKESEKDSFYLIKKEYSSMTNSELNAQLSSYQRQLDEIIQNEILIRDKYLDDMNAIEEEMGRTFYAEDRTQWLINNSTEYAELNEKQHNIQSEIDKIYLAQSNKEASKRMEYRENVLKEHSFYSEELKNEIENNIEDTIENSSLKVDALVDLDNIAREENLIISVSPYSDSTYAIKRGEKVTWEGKPLNSYRVADHWNFESRGKIHANLSNNQNYTQDVILAKYNGKSYDVIKNYSIQEKNDIAPIIEYQIKNNIAPLSEYENAKRYDDLLKTDYIIYQRLDNGDVKVYLMDSNDNEINELSIWSETNSIKELGENIGSKIYNYATSSEQRLEIGNDVTSLENDLNYFMNHRPTESGITADNMDNQNVETPNPKDILTHSEYYFANNEYTKESVNVLKAIQGNPDAEITIYRASPGNKINPGDWVTLSKSYAEYHNQSQFDGNGNILELKVKAKDIQYAGDDINEFGYFPQNNDIAPLSEELQNRQKTIENSYNIIYNKNGIWLGKSEYARTITAIHNVQSQDLNYVGINSVKTSEVIYLFEDNGFDDAKIFARLPVESKDEVINYLERSYENGIDIDTRDIDEIIENYEDRYQQNVSDNDVLARRRATKTDDILYQGESTSNTSSNNETITNNNRGKFREELENSSFFNDENTEYQIRDEIAPVGDYSIYGYELLGREKTSVYDLSNDEIAPYKQTEFVPVTYNIGGKEYEILTATDINNSTGEEYTNIYSPLEKNRESTKKKMLEKKLQTTIENESYKAINKATKTAKSYLEFNRNEEKEFKAQLRELQGKSKNELTNSQTYNFVENIINKYANRDFVYVNEQISTIQHELKDQIFKVTSDEMTSIRQLEKENLVVNRVKLSTTTGVNIDEYYDELTYMYPGYFSEDVTNDEDRLNAIIDFMNMDNTIVNKYTFSPSELKNLTTKVYNQLLDNSLDEQTINETKNKISQQVQRRTREVVKQELLEDMGITEADIDVGEDISALNMQITDPVRNNEKVFGSEIGKKINDATIYRTLHNEAERTRWLNNERSELKELGIKAYSKESAAVQKWGEGEYINQYGELVEYNDHNLASEFPNIETQNKIKRAAEVIKAKYESYLAQINSVLTNMGYDPIKARKDYMRHFEELSDKFSEWGTPLNLNDLKSQDLPTDINGLTGQFKPGKNYFASAQERKGKKTTYDAITGIDGYLEGASNLIFHTEDIQRYRALANLIRGTYGQTHGYENLALLTDEQAQQRIEDIKRNKLSKYAAWLDEQANALAGKKGTIDRSIERMIGRRGYTVLQTAKKQVGSNMTGYNVRSSLTNFASAIQGMSKTDKIAFVKATISTINNIFHDDGLIYKSDFLTSRFGSDTLSQKVWQKISNAGQILMSGSDYFTSNQIWRGKYFECLNKGMSENEAIQQADDFASRIMGNRSKGATAEIFNSQTLGLLTQFQLEVNNQWQSMIHDNKMDVESGNKTAFNVLFSMGQLFGASYLFNSLMKSLTGSDVMFDPIEILKTLFGWGDDDDDKTFFERMTEANSMIVEQLPFSSILTGGRIPISEAFEGVTTSWKAFTGQTDEYGSSYTIEDVATSWLETLPYWILPTGYSQIKKTVQGLEMYDDDLPVAGSYTDSGNLRFTADDSFTGKLKAALFGRYSSSSAQDYIDSGYKTISSSNIDEMLSLGLTDQEYREYRNGLSKAGSTNADKLEYINSLDYSNRIKNEMAERIMQQPVNMSTYNDYGSFEEFDFSYDNPEKYQFLNDLNISYSQYSSDDTTKEAVNWAYSNQESYYVSKAITDDIVEYYTYKQDIKNIKDNTTNDKVETLEYINSLNLDTIQKAILFKSYYSSYDDYNYEIVNYLNNNSSITLEEEWAILKKLGFNIDESNGTVSW